MSYVDPFGGGTLRPSPISFSELTLTSAVTQLFWPGYQNSATDPVVATKMDIVPSGVGYELRMPDARVVSNGTAVLFTNLVAMSGSFTVADSAGNIIAVVGPGTSYLVYLTSNATAAGTWRSIIYGVGSGVVTPVSFAGQGLSATMSQLFVSPKVRVPATISDLIRAGDPATDPDADYGGLVVNQVTPTGPFTLPSSTFASFWCMLKNDSAGALTLTAAPNSLNGVVGGTVTLPPGTSTFLATEGFGNWYTIGDPTPGDFAFRLLTKVVVAGVNVLSSTEYVRTVQRYTGAIGAPAFIEVPPVVQMYFVTNEVTGGTVTVRVVGAPGTSVTLAAGQTTTLFCDGTNVRVASPLLAAPSFPLLATDGAVGTPSYAFSAAGNTGFYREVSGWLSTTIAGARRFSVMFGGGVFIPSSGVPPSPLAGMVYYDGGTNKLRCYNGTIWNDLF